MTLPHDEQPGGSTAPAIAPAQGTAAWSVRAEVVTPEAPPAPPALAAMMDALACATPLESSRVLGRALEAIALTLDAGPAMVAIVAWPKDAAPGVPGGGDERASLPYCTPLWETMALAVPPRDAARRSFGRTFFAPSDGYIRARRWRALADDGTLLFAPPGVVDRLVGVVPIGRRAQMVVAFDRLRGQKQFTDKDGATLVCALALIARVARDATLCRGVDTPLSPRERETLRHLLGGASEKQMAADMGLTPASLHQMVVKVYRKLRVSSRSELMALFLAPPATPPP